MNLPNKLTIARVIAVPFFIAAYYFGWYVLAFIIFVAASLTDMLDGQIARKNNLVTNFGKIMDPLADKVLVYSCLLYTSIWSIIAIALGVFLVVATLTNGAGQFGKAVGDCLKGLFGFVAYILPFYLIVFGILLFAKKAVSISVKTALLLDVYKRQVGTGAGQDRDPPVGQVYDKSGKLNLFHR